MTTDQLRALLADLGPTGDEVAQALRDKQCKGWRGDLGACPVACYLSRVTRLDAEVSSSDVLLLDGGGWVLVTTPEPVADFVLAFDEGVYPDLVSD